MGRKNRAKRMKKKAALATITNNNKSATAMMDTTTATSSPASETATQPSQLPAMPHNNDKVVVEPPPSALETRLVLTQGRKDLKNAQLILLDPFRRILLDPTMAVASIVIPGIVSNIPAFDSITAKAFEIPFALIESGYSLLPFRKHQDVDLTTVAQNDLLAVSAAGDSPLPPLLVAPTSLQDFIKVTAAFGVSAAVDVASALVAPAKATAWIVAGWQVFRWLDSSQLDENLKEAIVKPLYNARLVDNINIYRKIQTFQNVDHAKTTSRTQMQSTINDASRFAKYATAAYGTGMIKASSDTNVSTKDIESVKTAIANHVGIDTSDIVKLCVSEGGNYKLLRHFVAIDHNSRSVVLAIRGTLSVSGALIDLQANDADFLSGKAHRGMSEMAINLWYAVGDTVRETFRQLENSETSARDNDDDEQLPPYGLVITGHSMGAGTAALLNLKLHVENLLGTNRSITCFALASPPVFYLPKDDTTINSATRAAIEQAIQNCTCVIHGEDVVPFLSVVSVAKTAAQLELIDDTTKSMNPLERMALASGEKQDIPKDLSDAVSNVKQPVVSGASRLMLPAGKIVWTFETRNGYDVVGCNANDLANLDVFMSGNMMTHHFPKGYEESLDALAV